jgi:hypothetical protein
VWKCRASLYYDRRHVEVKLELKRLTQFHNYTNTVITYVNFLGEFITNVVLILAFLYRVTGAILQTALSQSCESEDLNTFSPFSFGSKRLGVANSLERPIKTLTNSRKHKKLDRQSLAHTIPRTLYVGPKSTIEILHPSALA